MFFKQTWLWQPCSFLDVLVLRCRPPNAALLALPKARSTAYCPKLLPASWLVDSRNTWGTIFYIFMVWRISAHSSGMKSDTRIPGLKTAVRETPRATKLKGELTKEGVWTSVNVRVRTREGIESETRSNQLLPAQLLKFCGELRRFAGTVIFPCKIANKYSGNMRTKNPRKSCA